MGKVAGAEVVCQLLSPSNTSTDNTHSLLSPPFSNFTEHFSHYKMGVQFFNRNIPDECYQKMVEFANNGDDIAWLAFCPGGTR